MDEFNPIVLQDAHKIFDIKSANSQQLYKILLTKNNQVTKYAKYVNLLILMLKIRLIKFIFFHIMLRVKFMYGPFNVDC